LSTPAATPDFGPSATAMPETRDAARAIASVWWLWLVTGIAWIVAAVVILQFNSASVSTIGIIVGALFLFSAAQQFVLAAVAPALRWLWLLFGLLLGACGLVALFDPAATFAGLADVLGFLFLTVGVWWMIRAFVEREANPVWWLGLVSGVLMLVMAFWTSGQFFIHRAYVLLVFAGIWALMHGVTDIIRAFTVRSLRDEL
jgi:uncharacterized membrane protein HdeD (DUF308 family)